MPSTTITFQTATRDKLRNFARKNESWNDLLKRLYESAVTTQNAQVFFSEESYTSDELLERIERW